MKLFRYLEYIKENNESTKSLKFENPLDKSEILNLFVTIEDEGYKLDIKEIYFTYKGSFGIDGPVIEYLDPDESLQTGDIIFVGFKISIKSSKNKRSEDVTDDLRSCVGVLSNYGYVLDSTFSPDFSDGEFELETIHLKTGNIFIYIPEDSGQKNLDFDEVSDGDILEESEEIVFYFYYDEEIKIDNQEDLAIFFKWKNYNVGNGISFEISLKELSKILLPRNSRWDISLVDGLDYHDYDRVYYQPDINSLFEYYLNNNQIKKIIQFIIKDLGKDVINYYLEDRIKVKLDNNESEIIDFLSKEKFHKTLEEIFNNEEIELINEIRGCISDYKVEAHLNANQEELYESFDRMLKSEGIEFLKHRKEGDYFYIIYYDDWIISMDNMRGFSLEDVFREFVGQNSIGSEINPYFSDYGTLSKEEDLSLSKDIDIIINSYLREN